MCIPPTAASDTSVDIAVDTTVDPKNVCRFFRVRAGATLSFTPPSDGIVRIVARDGIHFEEGSFLNLAGLGVGSASGLGGGGDGTERARWQLEQNGAGIGAAGANGTNAPGGLGGPALVLEAPTIALLGSVLAAGAAGADGVAPNLPATITGTVDLSTYDYGGAPLDGITVTSDTGGPVTVDFLSTPPASAADVLALCVARFTDPGAGGADPPQILASLDGGNHLVLESATLGDLGTLTVGGTSRTALGLASSATGANGTDADGANGGGGGTITTVADHVTIGASATLDVSGGAGGAAAGAGAAGVAGAGGAVRHCAGHVEQL